MEHTPTIKVFRQGDELVIQGRRKTVATAENVTGLMIAGNSILMDINGKPAEYFEGDFPIKSVDVYEVEEGRFLGLDEIKTLTPIAHLTDEAYTTIPNTKDGRHWLILVCKIDLEA